MFFNTYLKKNKLLGNIYTHEKKRDYNIYHYYLIRLFSHAFETTGIGNDMC